jgi:ATP-dependent RNA helicase DeaD
MPFKSLGLRPELLNAISELGFTKPTKIQELAIPFINESKDDLIAFAQTGTGKTAAFGLPILNNLDFSKSGVKAIILSPTRELCVQIMNDMTSFATSMNVDILAVYGGASIEQQIKSLRKNCDIVVGTPGRTLDLIKRKILKLENVQYVVLDEADEMLSMGFSEDMDAILATTPTEKQVLLFSATMPPEMQRLSKKYMKNPQEVSAGSKKEANVNVEHIYYQIQSKDRYLALKRAVDVAPDIYGIIFCRTRSETKDVAEKLAADGYNTDSLHGDLSQAQRDHVMGRFRSRQLQILVATDVAARGLDVSEITHVINYNLPDEEEVYVHRSGRTGRASNEGKSIVLVTARELHRIRKIESKIGRKFKQEHIPTGQEICEKQLFSLLDNILNTEIISSQIEDFLPNAFEMLKDISKEDLIRKVVSVEFNRFLNYYRNAPDLNVQSKESASREGRSRSSNNGYVRYFINLGKKDGLNPKKLLSILNEGTRGKSPDIGQIEILKMFSFFEMEKGFTKDLLKISGTISHNDRTVTIEEAGEKPSSSRNRGNHKRSTNNRKSSSRNKESNRSGRVRRVRR